MNGYRRAGSLTVVLFEYHRAFLSLLEQRVGSRADAEEILQSAYVKSVEKGHTLRDPEKVTAWSHRLLKHAIIDHHRRRVAERRSLLSTSYRNDRKNDGEVACRVESLSTTASRTAIFTVSEPFVDEQTRVFFDRVTRIEVRGENVAHVFPLPEN